MYVPRTVSSTDTDGLPIYLSTSTDKYAMFKYNGNGDSFIRICFSKDCQNTNATSYKNSFFEITLDEGGNTGTFSLKYIDTDASVTILDTVTVPTLDLTVNNNVDFHIAFDLITNGIMFGNSDQVGTNVLLFNDLTQCCDNYPSNNNGDRYTQPFRNVYYGSIGSIPNNNVEITFCSDPIDLCPDFEIDYDNLVAYYTANNFVNEFDNDTEIETYGYWRDISYYGNHIESDQITNILSIEKGTKIVAGEAINVVSGDSSVAINIDSALNSESILPSLYTLITVARRVPSNSSEGSIFEADSNYISGFGLNNEIGYASRDGVILTAGSATDLILTDPGTLSSIIVDSNSFIISSDKRSSYRVQGIDTTETLPSLKNAYINFGINTNPLNGPSSSFEISEILIFNTELTLDEICCIEYYLAERNKIRSQNGLSLYTTDTYPSCCIEVDEYPIFNPTDTDITTQSNPAKASDFKKFTTKLFGVIDDHDNKAHAIIYQMLFYVGLFVNMLLLIFVCVLFRCAYHKSSNIKVSTYNDIRRWSNNDSNSDMEHDNDL